MDVKSKFKLELDSYYSDNEIIKMGLKPMNGHKMNYIVFEKESMVYFFEKPEKDLYRLFCVTKRQSFYLS